MQCIYKGRCNQITCASFCCRDYW